MPRTDTFWRRLSIGCMLAVLALATIGCVWWSGRDIHQAIEVTIALLVVTCPCAIGLAVPLAREVTCAALRRRGIFLRKGGFLERARQVRKILFDKTGTLTSGRLLVSDAGRRALRDLDPADRSTLRAMTACSNHPVSAALQRALQDSEESVPGAARDQIEEHAGRGISWPRDGHEYRLGKASFAGVGGAPEHVCFSKDGIELARFELEEELPAGAEEEIAALERSGYEVHLLSGDRPERVAAARARLGLPSERAAAGLSPEAKAERVRALDDHDTLMVGDGLNDTLGLDSALAAATPAVHHGAISARSDFYYHGDGIASVRWTLLAAARMHRVIRDNLWLALAYNAIVVGLCLTGHVRPVTAAILMPISSSGFVILTTLRLSERRFGWTS
ncbi:MAG: HAD family hydrolase [Candidatus Eisenbacteria bacterium]